jgi:hypothetical protein
MHGLREEPRQSLWLKGFIATEKDLIVISFV